MFYVDLSWSSFSNFCSYYVYNRYFDFYYVTTTTTLFSKESQKSNQIYITHTHFLPFKYILFTHVFSFLYFCFYIIINRLNKTKKYSGDGQIKRHRFLHSFCWRSRVFHFQTKFIFPPFKTTQKQLQAKKNNNSKAQKETTKLYLTHITLTFFLCFNINTNTHTQPTLTRASFVYTCVLFLF